jgi:hypothetical protein
VLAGRDKVWITEINVSSVTTEKREELARPVSKVSGRHESGIG